MSQLVIARLGRHAPFQVAAAEADLLHAFWRTVQDTFRTAGAGSGGSGSEETADRAQERLRLELRVLAVRALSDLAMHPLLLAAMGRAEGIQVGSPAGTVD